jgi:hypothetical protein
MRYFHGMTQMVFTRSIPPGDGYEAEWIHHRLDPEREYSIVRVRAYKDATVAEARIEGAWSEWSDPIYVPEAPTWLALPACILLLLFMKWLSRALGRLP